MDLRPTFDTNRWLWVRDGVKLGDITKESMATYSKHIQTDATWGCNMMLFQWGCDEEFEVWLRELSIFICSLKRQREGMRAFRFGVPHAKETSKHIRICWLNPHFSVYRGAYLHTHFLTCMYAVGAILHLEME